MASALPPAVEITNLVKDYHGLRPLRIGALAVQEGQRVALAGLDATAAEVLVNLVNGAILPDSGRVRVFGRDTAAIADQDDWLASLDRFGIVTPRAVLLEGSTLLQNLALPLSLDLDDLPADVHERVVALAERVGLDGTRLDARAGDSPAHVLMRVRLARALAGSPRVLIFEHPTLGVAPDEVPAFAHDALRVASEEGAAVLAITNDVTFAGVVAERSYTLKPGSGEVVAARGWRRWLGM